MVWATAYPGRGMSPGKEGELFLFRSVAYNADHRVQLGIPPYAAQHTVEAMKRHRVKR